MAVSARSVDYPHEADVSTQAWSTAHLWGVGVGGGVEQGCSTSSTAEQQLKQKAVVHISGLKLIPLEHIFDTRKPKGHLKNAELRNSCFRLVLAIIFPTHTPTKKRKK